MTSPAAQASTEADPVEVRVNALLGEMTLAEKIGQMSQRNASSDGEVESVIADLRAGRVGSVINQVDVAVVNEMQRVAVEESRLGIPLLVGRDVIHGFKTVMPIPLGQAATFNPDVVEAGAAVAAREAATSGVNWTFAPMIDIARDARWGRIAESLGEDPYLTSVLGAAMVQGFQGDDLSARGTIAACAKHFAGYGESESGRDYATTNIPENELRNVHLRPFKAAIDAGVTTLMASFSDLDGVPATGNEFLMRQVLREEWTFDGFVVSDWDSVRQLQVHGLTANDRDSAFEAANAGVDMEMAGDAYANHLERLVEDGRIDVEQIDTAVRSILRAKFRLGLFEIPYTDPGKLPPIANDAALQTAQQAALQSVVLLRNEQNTLPLHANKLRSIAVLGPLADTPYEQLGTWIFDGDPGLSVTPLEAIREHLGDAVEINHLRTLATSRSRSTEKFGAALELAQQSDIVVLFLGEESILSGEAHSRADINLPGAQARLVQEIRKAGKPVVAVIQAGRPLTLSNIADKVDAMLFAWHPGTMGGPAITDLLFGVESPSGKLPATFPRMVGQIPIYYNQKHGGKPPIAEDIILIDDIDAHAPQLSTGMTSYHLDAGFTPLYPFGFGLSYAMFEYNNIRVSTDEVVLGDSITIAVELSNYSEIAADEVVQLYVRDLVGSVTRPAKELKGFRRVRVQPGETQQVSFDLHTDDLAFYGRDMSLATEPGEFRVWIGGSSAAELEAGFRVIGRD